MTSSMLRRQLKNLVQNYSEAEVKVREATSNDPWGPSSTQMADISDLTYNAVACSEIMTMLWKRLKDDRNWRHIHKSLTLLEYLLKTGDDRVLLKMKDNVYIVKALTEYRFVEKDGKDQGGNVREKAKVVLILMEDDEKLKEERDFAVKTREKTSKSAAASSSDVVKDASYRPCYVPGATGLPSLDNIPSVADLTASFTARKEERVRQEVEKKETERRAKMSEDELKWEDAGKGADVKGNVWAGENAEEEEQVKPGSWGSFKEPKEATAPWGTPTRPDATDKAPGSDPWGAPSTADDDQFATPKTDEDPFVSTKTEEDPFAVPKNGEDPFVASKDGPDPFNAPKDDPFSAPKDNEDPFTSSNSDPFNTPKDDPFSAPKDDPFNAPKDDPFKVPKDDPFNTPKDDQFNSPKDDPFNNPKDDPFNSPKDDPFNSTKNDPFNTPKDDLFNAPNNDPFNTPKDDPFNSPKDDPFSAPKDDPFTAPASAPPKEDPFAALTSPQDPFIAPTTPPKEDPFSAAAKPAQDDPFAAPPPKEDPFSTSSKLPEDDPFTAPTTPPKEDPFSAPTKPTKTDPFTAPTTPLKEDNSDPFNASSPRSPKGGPVVWEAPASSPPATGSDPWGAPSAPPSDPWGATSPINTSDPFGDVSKADNDPWGAQALAPASTDDAWGSPAPPLASSPSSDPFGDGASKANDPWGAPSSGASNVTGKRTAQEEEMYRKTAQFLGSSGASLVDLDDLFSSKPKQRTVTDMPAAQTQAIGSFKAPGLSFGRVLSSGSVAGVSFPQTSSQPSRFPLGSAFAPSRGAFAPTFGAANPSSQTPRMQLPYQSLGASYSGLSVPVSVGGSQLMGRHAESPRGGVGMVPRGNPLADPTVSSFFGGSPQTGVGHVGGFTPQPAGGAPVQPQPTPNSRTGETGSKNSNPFQF
ncbi:epsin-1-like [Solea solea]|uniref:epsin-1-like n=1 Tax=Solea solea TaxID=90069 RepID=UPI00272A9A7E|nr:epsin-1-like [Solea solea]XP_058474402.1 epsin-1-like [Solea solea]